MSYLTDQKCAIIDQEVGVILKLPGEPHIVFTARRYASAVYAVVMCPSVRLFVCLSQADTTKTVKHRITQTTPYDSPRILVSVAKDVSEIPMGPPAMAPQIDAIFDHYLAI